MNADKEVPMGQLASSVRQFALAGMCALLGACGQPAGNPNESVAAQPAKNEAAPDSFPDANGILTALGNVLANYRQLIVLFADEAILAPAERPIANRIGLQIFHENLALLETVESTIDRLYSPDNESRFAVTEGVLAYVESAQGLFDADRLAFRDALLHLQRALAADGTLPAIKLHKRVSEDLDALDQVQDKYDTELRAVFSRFDTRAIDLKRQQWSAYLEHLKTLYSRERILKDHGEITAYAEPPADTKGEEHQLFGYHFPDKTVALTFDDGPHRIYTEEIAAILKQYGAPAVFFQVGRNLGKVDDSGAVKLSSGAPISRNLDAQGFAIANHSYSHVQLSKASDNELQTEIGNTDKLLRAVSPNRSALFRFPYGDNSEQTLRTVRDKSLQAVNWNIDSLDWADPVPESIVERVLRLVKAERRGIVLFHDINERTVAALPRILEQLVADGYRFARWDGSTFVAPKEDVNVVSAGLTPDYGSSWAVVIGIDEYSKWPRLEYAVRDMAAVRSTLVEHLGFASDHVIALQDGQATRDAILDVFYKQLAQRGMQKNDRLFVFYAGHGATRRLSSNRDLGYIIPVDSDPDAFAADAIPMSEIQNIAEGINARHVLFVMDACYSGLGLTRGSSTRFLKENARRIGRQMLTAGGADQVVADSGPNGHSVFTWTFLQALSGKGDLNGDGLITGTELAAYVAPAVSGVSLQTPAFGSLPGSEGGEFVFERQAEMEFLTADTLQLPTEAITMNQRLADAQPDPTSVPVKVVDLQGRQRTLTLPKAVTSSSRQLAQRANDRGLQLYREMQYDAAEEQFTEALKLRPDFALAANNLGFVYFKRRQYAEAVRWYENAIKLDPSRAVAYLNLGDGAMQVKDTARARNAFKTYLELSPNGPSADHARQMLATIEPI